MRRFFIGDIHGCSEELLALLTKINYNPEHDTLYSVGDVINKGPDSCGVLDIIKDNNIQCVLGNHDNLFLDIYAIPAKERTPPQHRFMSQFKGKEQQYFEQISSWPLYRELDDIIVVHAGLEPGNHDIDTMDKNILLSIRTWDGTGANIDSDSDPKWYDCDIWDKKILFGHWAKNGLVHSEHFIGLDTGCVYGGALTAYCPEHTMFFEAPSSQPKQF